MIILKQSPMLKKAFEKQAINYDSVESQEITQGLGSGLVQLIGKAVFYYVKKKNKFIGHLGERQVSLLLQSLPDSWIMFDGALIPKVSGRLTEIDHLIIGTGGVFLVEVKTWKGSYRVIKNKWKRREGDDWVEISQSPSSQSIYHQKTFCKWAATALPWLPDKYITSPVVIAVAEQVEAIDCPVPVLQDIPALLSLINNAPECLTAQQVQEIADAIANI